MCLSAQGLVVFVMAVTQASAFVVNNRYQGLNRNTIRMGYEDALGAQPPLGFFDPLGMLNDVDEVWFYLNCYVHQRYPLKHNCFSIVVRPDSIASEKLRQSMVGFPCLRYLVTS